MYAAVLWPASRHPRIFPLVRPPQPSRGVRHLPSHTTMSMSAVPTSVVPRPSTRGAHAVATLGALALAFLFVRRLATYWTFFHMGSGGGPGMFLLYIGLPISVSLALGLALGVTRSRLRRHGDSGRAAAGRGLLAVLLLFTALFTLEAWRTRDARRPDAEPPGTLAEYFRAYPW